jgi:methyltransferase (TIGR00027 family)
MTGQALPGVSRTAVWTAEMRASEGARADRLFDDAFAGLFVSAAGDGVASAADLPPGSIEFLAIRTRFFDDQIRAACAAGIRQVVMLAAGLDCRAFRLDWPGGVRLFELDLPEMFAFKEPVLASAGAVARCARVVVAVDLRGQWAGTLSAAGFDPGAMTAWVGEGLLPYLRHVESDRLLAAVTDLSAPGSRVAFDYIEATAADRPAVRAASDAVRQMGAQLMPTVHSPAEWLARHGWRAGLFRAPALGDDYGRPLPSGVDMVAANAAVLTAASR